MLYFGAARLYMNHKKMQKTLYFRIWWRC